MEKELYKPDSRAVYETLSGPVRSYLDTLWRSTQPGLSREQWKALRVQAQNQVGSIIGNPEYIKEIQRYSNERTAELWRENEEKERREYGRTQ
jgi:hypothetical protein